MRRCLSSPLLQHFFFFKWRGLGVLSDIRMERRMKGISIDGGEELIHVFLTPSRLFPFPFSSCQSWLAFEGEKNGGLDSILIAENYFVFFPSPWMESFAVE